ncbi:unnamed protein product [Orchesella dallaii]|uniref:LYR motif-containing protein 2 n=1 Tax=Orchesella dallaii TaxID=48710 RepID=A0ABP1RG12_9HEXA
MPSLTFVLQKLQKPPMSLKQFMLRSEVLKLYRGFMRLGRLMDTPSPPTASAAHDSSSNVSKVRNLHPLQLEWIDWVRSEFRLRQGTTEEELIRMMLSHGKRQLQEMERTIMLATNRNSSTSPKKPGTENASEIQDKVNKIS